MREKVRLYRRKKSDWDAERKVSDWNAKFYEAARNDRKNVVSMRDNWLRATGLYNFDNFGDEGFDDEFDHLIDDRIRFDSRWYKTMIWLSWWCSWCYHLLHMTLIYDMCVKYASIYVVKVCYIYYLIDLIKPS